MTGVSKSDLLLSTASTPKTERSVAVQALKTRGAKQPERVKGGALSKLLASLHRARARRQTIDQLSNLDDAILRDIGLEPGTLSETVEAALDRRNASYQTDNHDGLSQAGQLALKSMRRTFARLDRLQRLNDRLLDDVGISRGDLESNILDQRVAAANHNRALFRAA
ncbi:MAG: hypothetical protein Kilf2KO_17700 [Rhodospirillales bacterium]